MPNKYKLTYFNGRGLAELTRLILAQAGADFEDIRIERDKWPEFKSNMPFAKLPVLEVNGKVISESRAIARYIARQHGLTGKDDFEAALCDMIVDALYDIHFEMRPYFLESDEAKKAELLRKFMIDALPPALERFQNILKANNGGNAYVVGNQLTWADIALAHYMNTLKKLNPKVLDNYKTLERLHDRMFNLPKIKKWVETRPDTPF